MKNNFDQLYSRLVLTVFLGVAIYITYLSISISSESLGRMTEFLGKYWLILAVAVIIMIRVIASPLKALRSYLFPRVASSDKTNTHQLKRVILDTAGVSLGLILLLNLALFYQLPHGVLSVGVIIFDLVCVLLVLQGRKL